ncbi:ABC-type glycerol-3-phosphate transport system substrate-binding protein [Paenibacillus castaneae]|uniref:extracellular solute-binding protein n=1 Tax=Paenibacillus castaneae TaxID=474957 RepID=UPI001FD5334F|nr:extracellular solute-binding protein [Paenibacillus castaneae]NIK77219.1 ABC-type glycerol-3-phosphate transport system substrate-binding protein [Paenibacillus castaneae]
MISNYRLFNITRKILPVALAILIVLPIGSNFQAVASPNASSTDIQSISSTTAKMGFNERKYVQYLSDYESAARPEREIVLEAADYSRVTGTDFEKLNQYEGMDGSSLLTGESGSAEWTFEVGEAGLYNLSLLYYPIEGKSSSIERALYIDGERPFREAAFLQFDRIWDNQKAEIIQDNQGNDLRPKQVEKPRWSEKTFQDSDGYENEPFLFYFAKGTHTIKLESSREPMVIKQLKLFQQISPLSYEDLTKQYDANGIKPAKDQLITIEAESAIAKSSPTLYPLSERSSAAVFPYSASKIKINTIGGFNWRIPGQWIEWEVDVPETGLYKMAFKSQQNFVRGIYSTRRLTIDGNVPFKEMEKVAFRYKSPYRIDVMGGDEPYLYHLEKGKHVLRMEVSLGEFAPLIREVEESLYNLNEMYRKILMITGTKPDEFRDYQLNKKVPDLLKVFESESTRLKQIAKELVALAGQSSDQEALLKTMALQLDEMIEKPDTVSRRLAAYKTNTGGLGTWVQQARQQPLEFDAIYLASPDKKFPKKGMNFVSKVKHETATFFSSFFIDYNQIGNVTEDKDQRSVTVWIGSGRDQANTMKAMIDETFTSVTGINVNLKLVNMGTLLPATLAGQGPDVAMQIDNDIPVNFAMRNASVDLTQFADFNEVKDRFRPSAIVPYSYENGVFALPETQTFNMLFYRKDVLNELHLDVPNTWDEVSNLLAVLSKNHMQFGLPVVAQAAVQGQNIPPNSFYAALLLQNGGSFYRNGGKESDLDSRVGIETFKTWTEYYTDYKLEREYDFSNRFRTGQMPIGIADYTTYNQLSVFAPEIRGMWGFAPIPGTLQEDGTINREVPSGGNAVIMLDKAKDKDAAWQFMKWWTSDATQTLFGREMEGLMGAAARYPTANIKALDSLPWPVADYENLKAQFEWVQGIPEVPGGYFTGRHLFNAFYKTVVGSVEARESIMDYVQYMQDEINTKRKEFGLPQ